MPNSLKLVISILLCLAIGFIASMVTIPAIKTWYVTLHKPVFTPPNYLFAPVWTILYIMMGVSMFLLWKNKSTTSKKAFWLFGLQLLLNFLWSFIFFYFKEINVALIDIILLLITIILCIKVFAKESKWASLLFVPYLLWVSFATALNTAIVILN